MSVVYFPWYVFKIYVFFPIEKCGKQGVREKKHLLWTQVWYLRVQVLYVRTHRYTLLKLKAISFPSDLETLHHVGAITLGQRPQLPSHGLGLPGRSEPARSLGCGQGLWSVGLRAVTVLLSCSVSFTAYDPY